MKTFSFIIIFTAVLFSSGCGARTSNPVPLARQGVLDLTGYDVSSRGAIRLNGEWEFYWRQFRDPGSSVPTPPVLGSGAAPAIFANLPGLWNDTLTEEGEPRGSAGFATYRLRLRPGTVAPVMTLKIPDARTAYRLYLNGALIAENGQAGISRAESRPDWHPLVVNVRLHSGENEILWQVSNFHHRKGGIQSSIMLGTPDQIQRLRDRILFLDLFLVGALLIISVNYFTLFLLQKKDPILIYFAAFCSIISLRTVMTGERYLLHVLPFELNWEVALKIEYFGFFLALPVFFGFIHYTFPRELPRKVFIALSLIALPFLLLVLVTPARIYTHSMVAFQVYTVLAGLTIMFIHIRAAKNSPRYLPHLTGFLVLLATVANDILHNNNLVSTGYLVAPGVFCFVCLHAFLMARKYTGALETVEQLTGKLERTVNTRTRELSRSRQELSRLNDFLLEIGEAKTLDLVLEKTFVYIEETFEIEGLLLLLTDPDHKTLRYYRTPIKAFHTQEMIDYVTNLEIPLVPEIGSLWNIYQRKRGVYLPKINPDRMDDSDPVGKLARICDIRAALIEPLEMENQVEGILLFSNYAKPMSLSRPKIESLRRFVNQISGAINGASLLQKVKEEREKSTGFLESSLPAAVARELLENKKVKPVLHENVTICFANFVGFTGYAMRSSPETVVRELNSIFLQFDRITEKRDIEKLKTIGDIYMCAGGLPAELPQNQVWTCLAALEMRNFIDTMNSLEKEQGGTDFWRLRLGLHSGPAVAGVIGKSKFAYDVWGDTVNVAARMESTGEINQVNISRAVYEVAVEFFICESRGLHQIKNRGEMEMFVLKRLRPLFSDDAEGNVPNKLFFDALQTVQIAR